ncbi:hypothetical protein EcCFBP13530_21575 [Enterobacter cancerogenus]|jgi:hypothetical protein|uniref:DUF4761 family protein n=1 Tax=Enterobacter cancerogenus TaxID=69218 RepID=A0AB38P0A7_9ENTR|nr:hypothetical protein EcCFBP13530_21575 [Enterobacter cancerogenus]
MKKRYSQNGSYAGCIPGLIKVSKNVYLYLGFTINVSPRAFGRRSYYIYKSAEGNRNYFGRGFAMHEACETVIRILNNGRFTAA